MSLCRLNFQHLSIVFIAISVGIIPEKTNASDVGTSSSTTSSVRVAAFNVRHFGQSKMSKPGIAENIVRIFQRYDLVFLMETRDRKLKSLNQLRKMLGASEWDFVASEPIGRTHYKEQSVYFYRPGVVKLLDTHVYEDSRDVFEREPYLALFQYNSTFAGSDVKVAIVGAHLDPDDVVAEMEALPAVISSAKREFPNSDGVIAMGDFNADCGYMNGREREEATLFSRPEAYTSYIPHKVDTTVSHKTDCAYDRIVVAVKDNPKVKVANAKTYDFEKGLGLSFKDAWTLSDHYPVEFTLE